MPEPSRYPHLANEEKPSFWDDKALLQQILGKVPNVLYLFNCQTRANDLLNGSLGSALGYDPAEIAALGADFMPVICHPDDLDRVFAHIGAFEGLQDGERAQVEYRMKHKNGTWRWMLSHDTVLDRDAEGKVVRLVGVATDITDRKLAEETAMMQKRAADAANDELRSFAYSVSHDLKSPTNTLHLLLSELLAQHGDQVDETGRELVSLGLQTASKMRSLVEDVLDYTRIIGSETAFEDVALTPLVQDIVDTLAADIKEAGAKVILKDLPVVHGSRPQLRGYFQNMISNAIKYRDPDRPVVVTVSDTTGPNDARVSIAVDDNGMGIAPEDHSRVFGIFKRLHLAEDIAGTGLGLALCQRVAINHSGAIALTSALGEGSCFTLDLEKP